MDINLGMKAEFRNGIHGMPPTGWQPAAKWASGSEKAGGFCMGMVLK
jgi:hypothetical protein